MSGIWNGLEIEMLSVGDADSILVTRWINNKPWYVLVDGGKPVDANAIIEFLQFRQATDLFAVVCSHLHKDHAGGLISIIRHPSITLRNGWMHDITDHFSDDVLRRASTGSSSDAQGVREVIERTKDLRDAFYSKGILPQEPFAGSVILPGTLEVLGPSKVYYERVIREFAKITTPSYPTLAALGLAYTKQTTVPGTSGLLNPLLFQPSPAPRLSALAALMSGTLGNAAIQENPKTQPFNNTSVIMGGNYGNYSMLFTADAGTEALEQVDAKRRTGVYWAQIPHHGSDGNSSKRVIELLCPTVAYISACGDDTHPDSAVVSALVKVGAKVFSTHDPAGNGQPGNLQQWFGEVPQRLGYSPAVSLKGRGSPQPMVNWSEIFRNTR